MSKKNKKRLRFSFTLTILLAIVTFFLYFNNRSSTIKQDESKFYVQDTASISKIYMVDKKDSSLLIERTDGEKWRLNKNYYVRKDIMRTLLRTLKKMRIKQPVAKAATANAIKDLAAYGTKVEVYQNTYRINLFNSIKLFPYEKLSKVFYVGYDTRDNHGTVMLLEGAETPYVIHIPGFRGALAIRFLVRTADWRDLTIFSEKINNIYKVEVETPQAPEESYKIVNNNDKTFSLFGKDDKEIPYADTMKVLRYINYMQNIHLSELFLKGDNVIDSLLSKETASHIFHIENMKGEKTDFKIFLKKNEEIPLMEDDIGMMTEKELQEFKKAYEPIYDPNSVFVIFNKDKDVGLGPAWILNKTMRSKSYFITEVAEEE